MGRTISVVPSAALDAATRAAVVLLCDAAYEEATAPYFADVGPGLHLLAHADGTLVAHLLLVDRTLETTGGLALHTAYVELVATAPTAQGRGHASALLREVPRLAVAHDLAALSPSDPAFYARLGWTSWAGPLGVRRPTGVTWLADETVMILRTPRTPAALDMTHGLTCEWRPGDAW